MEVIQELANQLGVAVENLLSAYTPYCFGVNIGNVTGSLAVFVGSIIVIVLSLKAMMHNYRVLDNAHDKYASERPQVWAYGAIAVIIMLVTLISIIAFVYSLPYLIGSIMSPQGAAIHALIKMVTSN